MSRCHLSRNLSVVLQIVARPQTSALAQRPLGGGKERRRDEIGASSSRRARNLRRTRRMTAVMTTTNVSAPSPATVHAGAGHRPRPSVSLGRS